MKRRDRVDVFDVLLLAGTVTVAGCAWWITGHPGFGGLVLGAVMLVTGFVGVMR